MFLGYFIVVVFHCTWGINSVKIDTTTHQGTKHKIPCEEELIFQLFKEVILNGSWALEAQFFDVLNVKRFQIGFI